MATVYDKFEKLPNGKYRPAVGNKPAAVAKDAAPAVGSMKWLADASESEVAAYMDKRLDAAADKEIAAMLPVLKVFAMDNAKDEAKALGLEGEEEDKSTELRRGQVTGNDDEKTLTIAERIAAGYRGAKNCGRSQHGVTVNAVNSPLALAAT